MREIKFRAWNECEKIMECDIQNEYDGDLSCFASYLNNDFWNVMQYTGLKDKNGIEIYEGDIISGGSGRVPTLIKWDNENNCWIAFNLRRKEEHCLDKYFKKYIGEVIGNIYENPELIKGEQ